jgi:hypothetical protein
MREGMFEGRSDGDKEGSELGRELNNVEGIEDGMDEGIDVGNEVETRTLLLLKVALFPWLIKQTSTNKHITFILMLLIR